MTKEQFGQSVKAKYPQYKNIDDEELANKMLDKYPVYNAQIDQRSGFRKVVDFFTENTQKFGTTLGTATSVVDPVTSSVREKTITSQQQTIDDLFSKAKTAESPERATKYLELARDLGTSEGIDIFQNKEYQKTAKQVLGEGLGTFLEVASLGSFGGGKAPAIVKPLLSKSIGAGAKTGALYGGAFGGGFGVSRAMQEDKSIGDIAKAGLVEGGIGTAGGAVLGGGLSALSVGASRGATKLSNQAQKLKRVVRNKIGEVAYDKLNKVSRALIKMSPTQTRNEAKWNKNTPKFLVDEGVVGLLDSDGKYLNTDDAVAALRDKYNAEATVFNNILSDSGEWLSLNKFKDKALATIGDDFKAKGSDYQKAKNYIIKEIGSYKNNYSSNGIVEGDDVLVPIEIFNKIKSGLWSRTSNFNPSQADKLLSDLNYKMGQTAKNLIEDTVEDATIKSMNSRLGDFSSAIKILQNANGKVLPGSFFGKQFTRLAGTVAGSGGGIPGSIIGNLTGGGLADLMTNPKIKTSTLNNLLKMLNKTPKGASLIDDANAVLLKRGEERASRKLLEASKIIFAGPPDPGKPTILSQEEAQQILRELGTIK